MTDQTSKPVTRALTPSTTTIRTTAGGGDGTLKRGLSGDPKPKGTPPKTP